MFYKGPETLIISSTPKGTDRLEARASDPACWLFKAYECNCGFLWLYNTLAIFGVNCLNKTQPQIGDFRLKNGKLLKAFIPPTFWPSRSPRRRRPSAAAQSQLTQTQWTYWNNVSSDSLPVTTHITADTTQCTHWDNVSSDFLLATTSSPSTTPSTTSSSRV